MRRLFLILGLLVGVSQAQTTTTITGTIKDLSQALVTSGKVTFTLQPSRDTTISGLARFSPAQVVCLINASGLIKAQDGTSVCTLTMNTALNPPGTYYRVDVWPFNVKTSSFTFYAVLSTYDWSTVVPTPTTSPAQNFVDIFSNQTIGGAKTFTGTNTGVFTNSQMNVLATSIINGINFSTEYQALQGNNFSTEGFAAGVNCIGSVHQCDGIAGYVTNSSTLVNAVGGYFQAHCLANSTACWGSNIVSGDAAGLTGVTLYGLEVDAAPLSNAGSYAGVFGYTANISGATGTGNYGSAFLAVSNVTGKFWNHGFETSDQAVQTAFLAGATCKTGSCGSQAIQFRGFNSSVLTTASIASNSSGDIVLNPQTNVVKINTIPVTQTIASGTASMTTAAISGGGCGSTVTVAATGVLTTDVVNLTYNVSIGTDPGVLILNKWPTANNVNFAYCNPTAGSITPPSETINWSVTR
jgi:hypothetical protein